MNGWLLDTNVLIDLIFARSPAVVDRYVRELEARGPMFLSAISVFEFRFGAERSPRRDAQLQALDRFLASVTVVDFDERDAEEAARIKADLAAVGTPIGAYDLLIAAQAKVRTLTVATGNIREFSSVRDLPVEDWKVADV